MQVGALKQVSRLVGPGPIRDAIVAPWRLDKDGLPPDISKVEELEAILGTDSSWHAPIAQIAQLVKGNTAKPGSYAVSYTHLTLPTTGDV